VLARSTGAEVGAGGASSFGSDAQLRPASACRGRLSLGSRCQLESGGVLHPFGGSSGLAQHVYLAPFTVTFGHVGVSLGHDKLIAMLGRILSSNHAVPPPGKIMRSVGDIIFPTHIGNDVWLGAGVTVLGGVTIGDGCVIGAGAVVTRDLPAGSYAMNVPATVWRQRTAR
jgi:acetyltransferase-like isoleucine patch superfamily enzyme